MSVCTLFESWLLFTNKRLISSLTMFVCTLNCHHNLPTKHTLYFFSIIHPQKICFNNVCLYFNNVTIICKQNSKYNNTITMFVFHQLLQSTKYLLWPFFVLHLTWCNNDCLYFVQLSQFANKKNKTLNTHNDNVCLCFFWLVTTGCKQNTKYQLRPISFSIWLALTLFVCTWFS